MSSQHQASSADPAASADLATLLPVPPASQLQWGHLYGSAGALAVAEKALRADVLQVVVTAGMPELLRLEAELGFFCGDQLPVSALVEWETLPYDLVSPHQEIIAQRIRTLYQLQNQQRGVLLLTASALMQKLAPRDFLDQYALMISQGDTLDPEQFRERLVESGYRRVTQVEEHGEFTQRGAIIDLYPMTSQHPLRIEFLDDDIDSIRSFDAETQRSIEKVTRIELLPAHEFPLNDDGIGRFRRAFRNSFDAESKNSPVYNAVSEGRAPAGIEYYAPLFFDSMDDIFAYLPASSEVVLWQDVNSAFTSFWDNTEERYEQRRHDIERPILAPDALYLSPQATREKLQAYLTTSIQSYEIDNDNDGFNFPTQAPGLYPINSRAAAPMGALQQFLDDFQGRVLLVAESAGRRETLLDQLIGNRIRPTLLEQWSDFRNSDVALGILAAPLDHGLQLPDAALAIITEPQLGSGRVRQRERRRPTRDSDAIIANLTDLSVGAPVVHIDHGVGRYQGLTLLDLSGVETEFLTITYAGEDKLYVPVSSLHLISRYAGSSEDSAPLHKLGSEAWTRAKRRAAEKAHDVAAELLEIHARRAARQGHAFPEKSDNYAIFAEAFAFEETPDQYSAIQAVVEDLRSPRPTDRVVCGDVGFGKTEVAMRAAFVAVDGGKQVAVLVPTTLLAQQHHQNFLDRFSDWPVRIAALSRFQSAAEQKQILAELAAGKLDIIIGTHKLLQKDIRYKNLGLVIVDEEHRFGVKHKEHMKALRAEVDIVTLTATPIPRTLSMGLSGLRDLSIIATAPAHRHAIKTIVCEWSDNQIREACARELARGGQVYFLHNEVSTIERIQANLQEIMPQARIRIGHGQMRESELEQVMYDFFHQRFDILLCTTIVESGIDNPSANTIIINRADKLGLAQLHQLRGRVGRSHHRAYAYLLAPPRNALTADAQKRLDAIESLEDLGIGFTLATHDLEIRGAGELLGEGQSGQIHEIGFTLYTQLLERAVEALKSGQLPDYDQPLATATEIDLGVPALLPDDYVPDVHHRLILYKRISAARDADELREMKVELIDRFGLLPPQTDNLFDTMHFKQLCAALAIERLELSAAGGRLVFSDTPNIDTGVLIQLIQSQPQVYRFDGSKVLRFVLGENGQAGNDEQQVDPHRRSRDFAESLLQQLTPAT